MELKLLGAFFLTLAVTPGLPGEARLYEVFYRSPVSESLCSLLPGHPMRFALPPSSQTKDRLEVSCDEKGPSDAPDIELKFWLDADVPRHYGHSFRWGHDVAAEPSPLHGQFTTDPGLCEKAKKIIEEAAVGPPVDATLHLRNAKLTAQRLPDALWGTSLELHLVTNQPPEPPAAPEQPSKPPR